MLGGDDATIKPRHPSSVAGDTANGRKDLLDVNNWSDLSDLHYIPADIAKGQEPSLAQLLDPNDDGILTEEEYQKAQGELKRYTDVSASLPFGNFKRLAEMSLENPERATVFHDLVSPRKAAVSDPSREAKYKQGLKLLSQGAKTKEYEEAKKRLGEAGQIFAELGFVRLMERCNRELIRKAVRVGRRADAAYYRAILAMAEYRVDEVEEHLKDIPEGYKGRELLVAWVDRYRRMSTTLNAAQVIAGVHLSHMERIEEWWAGSVVGTNFYPAKTAIGAFLSAWNHRLYSGQFPSTRAILEDIWRNESREARSGLAILALHLEAHKELERLPESLRELLIEGRPIQNHVVLSHLLEQEERSDPQYFKSHLTSICGYADEGGKAQVAGVANVYRERPRFRAEMDELMAQEFEDRGAFETTRDILTTFKEPENLAIIAGGYGLTRLSTVLIMSRLAPAGSKASLAARMAAPWLITPRLTTLGTEASLGAKIATPIVEVGIEALGFTVYQRLLTQFLTTREVDWSLKAVRNEWAALTLSLGFLRASNIPLNALRKSMVNAKVFRKPWTGPVPEIAAGQTLYQFNRFGNTLYNLTQNLTHMAAFYTGENLAYWASLTAHPPIFLEVGLTLLQFQLGVRFMEWVTGGLIGKTELKIQSGPILKELLEMARSLGEQADNQLRPAFAVAGDSGTGKTEAKADAREAPVSVIMNRGEGELTGGERAKVDVPTDIPSAAKPIKPTEASSQTATDVAAALFKQVRYDPINLTKFFEDKRLVTAGGAERAEILRELDGLLEADIDSLALRLRDNKDELRTETIESERTELESIIYLQRSRIEWLQSVRDEIANRAFYLENHLQNSGEAGRGDLVTTEIAQRPEAVASQATRSENQAAKPRQPSALKGAVTAKESAEKKTSPAKHLAQTQIHKTPGGMHPGKLYKRSALLQAIVTSDLSTPDMLIQKLRLLRPKIVKEQRRIKRYAATTLRDYPLVTLVQALIDGGRIRTFHEIYILYAEAGDLWDRSEILRTEIENADLATPEALTEKLRQLRPRILLEQCKLQGEETTVPKYYILVTLALEIEGRLPENSQPYLSRAEAADRSLKQKAIAPVKKDLQADDTVRSEAKTARPYLPPDLDSVVATKTIPKEKASPDKSSIDTQDHEARQYIPRKKLYSMHAARELWRHSKILRKIRKRHLATPKALIKWIVGRRFPLTQEQLTTRGGRTIKPRDYSYGTIVLALGLEGKIKPALFDMFMEVARALDVFENSPTLRNASVHMFKRTRTLMRFLLAHRDYIAIETLKAMGILGPNEFVFPRAENYYSLRTLVLALQLGHETKVRNYKIDIGGARKSALDAALALDYVINKSSVIEGEIYRLMDKRVKRTALRHINKSLFTDPANPTKQLSDFRIRKVISWGRWLLTDPDVVVRSIHDAKELASLAINPPHLPRGMTLVPPSIVRRLEAAAKRAKPEPIEARREAIEGLREILNYYANLKEPPTSETMTWYLRHIRRLVEWNRPARGKVVNESYISREIKKIVRATLPKSMIRREHAAANHILRTALTILQRGFRSEKASEGKTHSQMDIFKAIWKAFRRTGNILGDEPIDQRWIEALKYQFARFVRDHTRELKLESTRVQPKGLGRVKPDRQFKPSKPAKSVAATPGEKRDPIEAAMGRIAKSTLPKVTNSLQLYNEAREILMRALANLQRGFNPKRVNEGETPSMNKISGSLWRAYHSYRARHETGIDSQMIEQLKHPFGHFVRSRADKLKLRGERPLQKEEDITTLDFPEAVP